LVPPAGEILQRFFLGVDPIDHLRHVEALLVIEAAADVRQADDFVARFMHELRGHGAHVPEALNDDAASFFLDSQLGERLVAADHHAAPGWLPSFRAIRRVQWALPVTTAVVAWPTCIAYVSMTQAMVCSFVPTSGAGTSRSGTQPVRQFRGIAAGQPLELSARHLPRIANHSALSAAKGNVHHRALPRHPRCQRAHFVDGDIRSKADSALPWPAHRGVQHAISREHFQGYRYPCRWECKA